MPSPELLFRSAQFHKRTSILTRLAIIPRPFAPLVNVKCKDTSPIFRSRAARARRIQQAA